MKRGFPWDTLLVCGLLVALPLGLAAGLGTLIRRAAELPPLAVWAGAAVLAVCAIVCVYVLQNVLATLRLPGRIRKEMPGRGKEHRTLCQAALAVPCGREERALELLRGFGRDAAPDVAAAVRRVRAWAAADWLARKGVPVARALVPYPQLQALCFDARRQVALSRTELTQELAAVSAAELDALARDYVTLVRASRVARGQRADLLHLGASGRLVFLTGDAFLRLWPGRMAGWQTVEESLRRGGGPLLAGLRLLEHGLHAEAVSLLDRLSADGVLAPEAETVHRAAAFLLATRESSWGIQGDGLQRFFRDLLYCGCTGLGMLNFPLVERPEIVAWCREARALRDGKRAFIDELLHLWATFGGELAPVLSRILPHLLGAPPKGRTPSWKEWRQRWEQLRESYEEDVRCIMEGVVATDDSRLPAAEQLFARARDLNPCSSTPWVNLVRVTMLRGRAKEARQMTLEATRRFPDDAGLFLALGQLYAVEEEELEEAEGYFQRAHQLDKSSVEPLLMLGQLKLAQGHYADSQRYFEHALRTDGQALAARLGLAQVYQETRRFDLTVGELEHVARRATGELRDRAHYELYRTFREMGAGRRAIRYLDRVPTHFFQEPDELDEIASHLESERQYAKARMFLERALLLRTKRGGAGGEGDETGV